MESWLTYNWLDIAEGRCMVQVDGLDTCDPFSVIKDLMLLVVRVAWLDQRVKYDISVEVNDWDSGQSFAFVGQDPLTVQC